jgi:hypothetical protein
MAVSAWIEVTGLAIWAFDLWRAMGRRPRPATSCGNILVTSRSRLAEVVAAYPETIPVFLQFGFTMITNPIMRQTVARSVSLEQVCRLRHVDQEALLSALQATVKTRDEVSPKPDQLITIAGT